jgi:SSS family solute:Na+ symporter
MSAADWCVLIGTLLFITIYGAWKTRGSTNIENYLLGDKSLPWWSICLSVMATQASAITFLSTPGQAYESGLGFIQFYFGLPIAMVIISVTAIPIYYRLKVYTAYEYLESRFDLKSRRLAAGLFLVQRGMAAGITIYAPAIILSTILGWNLNYTNLIIGGLVIIYTVSGGTRAVSVTQKQQMAVMMGGMVVAAIMVIQQLPEDLSFGSAVAVAGKMGKLDAVDFSFNLESRYNFWAGITGGLFLALSYFGTDQSQVGRYLGGKSIRESRLGLLFNGLFKLPMQFLILFTGVMVFVFYQFTKPPVFFNQAATARLENTEYSKPFEKLKDEHGQLYLQKQEHLEELVAGIETENDAATLEAKECLEKIEVPEKSIRQDVSALLEKHDPKAETRDTDYVFITFIMEHLPRGIIGLLIAVMFCAAMSSTSSELNALASTTVIDFYKRAHRTEKSPVHYLNASKLFTAGWGLVALFFAMIASLAENLIQLVNIVGSLFYGTILGIFLVAFYVPYIRSNAVFIAALIAETVVLCGFFFTDIGYLWYNVIGCALVIIMGALLQYFTQENSHQMVDKTG